MDDWRQFGIRNSHWSTKKWESHCWSPLVLKGHICVISMNPTAVEFLLLINNQYTFSPNTAWYHWGSSTAASPLRAWCQAWHGVSKVLQHFLKGFCFLFSVSPQLKHLRKVCLYSKFFHEPLEVLLSDGKKKIKSLSAVGNKILCKTYFCFQILLIPCVLLLVELWGFK